MRYLRPALLLPALVILQVASAVVVAPSGAAQSSCISVGWDSADADCTWTFIEYAQSSSSGDAHTWAVVVQPANGGIRSDELTCTENGESGLWHDVYMDGDDVGDVCVPESQTPDPTITEVVIEDFKSYSWPKSQLTIQPPGGRTLVNLETIFFTDNDVPRTHPIVIAGRQVTVEATPVSYIWIHGDGTTARTQSPGNPHPRHDVFHVYESPGEVDVSVDTVYGNGRFRIGSGEWKPIPGAPTVTVVGLSEDLGIVEARPQLVIR